MAQVVSSGLNSQIGLTYAASESDGAAIAVLAAENGIWRFFFATVHYDAVPVHAGITVTLVSSRGTDYDTILDTSAANVQNYKYIPPGELRLAPGDAVRVDAPGGGGVIKAYGTIYGAELNSW